MDAFETTGDPRTSVPYETSSGWIDSEVVRFRRKTLVIGGKEQRTLRGRIVGSPAAFWKEYRAPWRGRPVKGRSNYRPWPFPGGKRYLRVYLESRRHGILTLLLPPTSAAELEALGAVAGREVLISMIDRGSYGVAAFRER